MEWVRFLDENNIHYVTRGPNTKRGEVSIHCPMCGEEDPSEHLGINLQTGKWGCHRDSGHRGKSARYLIKTILGCSSTQSWLIVKQYSHSDPDTLEAALSVLEADNNDVIHHDEDIAKQAAHQRLGPQFNDFSRIKPRGITKRFFTHLENRGYDNPQDVIERYDLRCALTGKYKDRIIIPVKLNDELLGWTGRAIGTPRNAPRYLASNEDVKTTIFNYDDLRKGGDRLFIVEGPFDAMRIDNHNFTKGNNLDLSKGEPRRLLTYRATCTFGTSVTISQLALLRALVKQYDEAWILFDKGAEGPASDLSDWVGVKTAYLPDHIDDPGELKEAHLDQLGGYTFDGQIYSNSMQELISNTIHNRAGMLAATVTQGNALLRKMKHKP